MARRKKVRRRGGFFKKTRRSGRKATSMGKAIQFDSMIYGAARGRVSNYLAPYTAKIPLGSIADEVGMGILCYFVAKKTGAGMLRNVALKGLVIENARIGDAVASGAVGIGGIGGGNQLTW